MHLRLLLLGCCMGLFSYIIAQPNNNCGNALPIPVNNNCLTAQDNTGATEDIGPGSCTNGLNQNVWYSFTAVGYSAQINVTGAIGTPEITLVYFPNTPCSGADAQEVDCASGNTLTVDGELTIGTTYYIMVASQSNTYGTFDICLNNPVPAPNDNCLTATPIGNLNNNCFATNNTFPSTDVLVPGCFTGSTYNVWYSFVAQGVSLDVYLPAGGPGVGQIAVVEFANPCTAAGATILGCATGTNHVVLDNDLVIGQTYYLVVGFQNSNFNGNGIGAFDLCINNPIPAPNDDCMTPIVIPTSVLNDPVTCFTTISGNPLNNNYPSTDVGLFGCWDPNASYNIWYSFVAQGPDVEIEVDPEFGSDPQIALVQFTGAPCEVAGAQLLACAAGTVLDFNDQLIPGQTYYIAVGFTNIGNNPGIGNFCMNVFNPVPPPNDQPCNAIVLPTNGNCQNGTTIYANPEFWNVPGDCVPGTANTVWYTMNMNNPNNVGFEIDVNFSNTPPGMQVSIILWELVNGCNSPGVIPFFYCGPPPSNTLEWGPIDENTTYYLSISTSEPQETNFSVCAEEIPPCFTNDDCETATVINGVGSDQPFVCVQGCNLFADPETFANSCGIQNFPTVWFQVNTDGAASLMNIQVTSSDVQAPTITLFHALNGCNQLQPVGMTSSGLPCVIGSNGTATALGTPVGASEVYYIAVSSLNSVGGEFQLCVNTISVASACVTNSRIDIVGREFGSDLNGPFFPGERVQICMRVLSYTSAGNGCQWFQGVAPIFGNGWDPSSFDGNGMPIGATLNGGEFNPTTNGLYGATWAWFTDPSDVAYHHTNPFYYVGDLDGNGSLDMCSNLYDPQCPMGNVIGGCCGPCWDNPGAQLPGGWFAYNIQGNCGILGYPNVDYGDGQCCGCTMGPWNFCFELTTRSYPNCLQDETTNDLTLGFFTFADGETGSWTGGASVCALDQPIFVTNPMCCTELEEDEEILEPICSGQQFVYSIDEPGVTFWQWTVQQSSVSGGQNGQGGPGATLIHTLTTTGASSGTATYTFLGFGGDVCPIYQKTVTIEVHPPVMVTFDPVVFCSTPTSPYTLSPNVSGGSGIYSYEWNPGGSTGSSIMISNPSNGATYTVTVTDNIGCSATGQISLSVYSNFPVNINESALEQCIQDGPIDLDAVVSGGFPGYTYMWTTPGGSGSGQSIQTTQSGQHLVVVTDSEGCSGRDSVILTFHETPAVDINAIGGVLAICENESTELVAVPSMGSAPYSFEWDTPDGFETGRNITAWTPGLYTVTVTDDNGCTNSHSLQVDAQPQPNPDLGPDKFICNSDYDTEISLSSEFAYYQWSGPGFNEQGPNLYTIYIYEPGTYSVTVTNYEGCVGSSSVNVILHNLPAFPMEDEFPICPGQCVELNVDDYNGPWDNYEWAQFPLAFNDVTICTPGTYQVTVYDANQCPIEHEFTVVETSSIVPGLVGDNVICSGETITLTAATGFANYQWSPNTGAGNSNTADITSPGTYILTVYDAEGCYGVDSIVVNSGDFTATISGPTSICTGVLATIDAGAGYVSYLWSYNGETTRTVQVPPGTYSVTVTSTDGCTAEATTTIVEQPFVPTITGDQFICPASASTTLDASGGGPHMSYQWSANAGSATTPTVVVNMPGTYTVTVTDVSGCTGNAAFTVAYFAEPFVTVAGSPDFCVGGHTTINATAGYPGYAWSNSELTPSIIINEPGLYTVTITDDNGCTNSASMTVNQPYQETVTITGSFVFCPGDFATLAVPAGYASVLWSTGETDDQIYVPTEGEVSVIVIDADGCIAYDTVTTQSNGQLSPNITGNPAICDNGSTTLNAGPGFDNYLWGTGETTQTIVVNMPGTYTVTVSSNSGCMGEDDFTVVQYTTPFAVVTPNATVCDKQEPGGPPTSIDFNSMVTGGDTGGSWVQSSGPSTVNLSNLANVNFNGLNQGTYTFTYTTNSATPPCTNQSYVLTVDVVACSCPELLLFDAPDLCNNAVGTVCLNTLLLPQTPTGGAWTITAAPAGANPATINMATMCFEAMGANAGTYTLNYQVAGLPDYCADNVTLQIQVYPNPDAGTAAPAPHYCENENVVVTLSTLLVGADAGGYWVETSQFPSTGGAFDQTNGRFNVSAQAPGTYRFEYVLTGPGPCNDDMTTVEIVIEANPVADAGSTQSLDCLTESVTLGGSGTSTGPGFSYYWSTTDGIILDPTILNPVVTAPGTYELAVTNTATGCISYDQVVVDAIGEFPTDFNLSVYSPDCAGDPPGSAQVLSVVGGTPPYRYSLNNAPGVTSGDFQNLPTGHYTLVVTDATGCTVAKDFEIEDRVIVDLSIINYQDTTVYDLGEHVRFGYVYSGTTSVPDSLVWKTRDSIICINCVEIDFDAWLGTTITVEAWDERGCFISKSITYQVIRKRDVYIPNVFSPNGDGINDMFTLFTDSDVREIKVMEIYSRWGELLFRKSKFAPNDPSEGWDGHFRGETVNPGVYVYLIEVVYGDDVERTFSGDITIVK